MIPRLRRRTTTLLFAMLAGGVLLFGCEDDTTEPGDFNDDRLNIIPSQATVAAGGVQDFDAEARGQMVGSAQWRILSDNAVGSITSDGTYTAPDQVAEEFSFEIEAEVPGLYGPVTATVTVVPN